MPDNRSTAVHSSASRFRRSLVAISLLALAACGRAVADPSPKKAPPHPTAAEVRRYEAASVQLWDEAVYTGAVIENQTKWYLDVAAIIENYVPPAPPAPRPVRTTTTQRPAVTPQRSSAPAPSNVGGACGGATNGADRFIGAESGGNPNARNSSGAWGCYQIMPGTWQSSCSDLGQHGSASTQAQAQCASRLPSSSWAATGG